jgi:hypothetical protein
MQTPDGTASTLNPLLNKATIGEARLRFIDIDATLTDLLSWDRTSPTLSTLINRRITIYGGYRDEPESEYQQLFTGEIRGVEMPGPLTYEFLVVSLTRRLEELLFSNLGEFDTTSELENEIFPVGSTSVKVKSATAFGSAFAQGISSVLLHRSTGSQFERMTVSSVDSNNNLVYFTTPISYQWGGGTDFLTTGVHLRGNIVNVFASLCLGVFSTDPTSDFPLEVVSGSPTGLSLLSSDLDVTGLQEVRDGLLGDLRLDFVIDTPVKAREFFEQEIYPLGFFPSIAGDGTIGIRVTIPPGPQASAPKVYKQHMLTHPKWKRLITDHYNRVLVFGDYNLANKNHPQLSLQEDTADQTLTQEVGEIQVKSRGLRTALDGVASSRSVAARILKRWVVPPIEVSVEAIFTKVGLEVGDIVEVTHPALPDTTAATLGLVGRLMTVVRVQPSYQRGAIEITLNESSVGARFCWLGPSSMNDYGSATDEEKKYAYWGDVNNKVNSGTEDGYEIY